jgi:hypothetical protein
MARRKSKSHKQKVYKMKGCSKSRRNNRRNTRKNKKYLGGANPYLAYPSNNVRTVTNPHLAYNGKGGKQVYPNPGPPPQKGNNFINPSTQRGGSCGCGLQTGGTCSACGPDAPIVIRGGGCSNNGIPYPNGLVGSGWSINHTPGTGVVGDYNHYKFNTQVNNPQMQMIATGAAKPFLGGGRKGQKGGAFDNFLFQDVINLGRQLSYGLGSAYNTVAGYAPPVNPLPWKGQLPNNPGLSVNKPVSL